MKKIVSYAVLFALLVSLCGCGAANAPTTQQSLETNLPTTAASVVTTQPSVTSVPAEPTVPTQATIPTDTIPTEPKEFVWEICEDVITTQPRLWETRWQLYGIVMKLDMPDDSYPGMVITFDLCATYGELWSRTENLGSELTMENHQEVYWRDLGDPAATREYLDNGGAFFITAVIRADGNIVGYGLLEIGSVKAATYGPARCETVCFPINSGQLQYVSEEYVQEKLAEAQKTRTPFDRDAKRVEEWAYLFGEAFTPDPSVAPNPVQTTIIVTAPYDISIASPDTYGDTMLCVQDGYQFLEFITEKHEDYNAKYLYYYPNSSYYSEILIWAAVTDADIQFMPLTYEARTNYGALYNYTAKYYLDRYEGQEAQYVHYVNWQQKHSGSEPVREEQPDHVWIDVVARANGCIVGFMVLEIIPWPERPDGFTVRYCYSEGYLMQDGHYQNITEEFVNARIEAYHNYAIAQGNE